MLLLTLCTGFITFGSVYASFEEDCLKAHNELRERHATPPLKLDEQLQTSAQNYAQKLADADRMEHSQGSYGENLYSSSLNMGVNAKKAVQSWYDEKKDYDYGKNNYQPGTGHFTQVVWKSSQKLGCAFAKNGNNIYVVAQYTPAGNMAGDFERNVLRSGSNSILTNIDSKGLSALMFVFSNLIILEII